MEPILEFKTEFGKKDYYIYLQIKKDSIYIGIEFETENNEILYWKKNLENETIKETTSQMGSFKSLQAFSEMLIDGLSKNNTNSITIDFCSLNEIRELAGNDNITNKSESNIKKYLVIMSTKQDKVVYPIQMDYLGTNGTIELVKFSLKRIKKSYFNNENIKKLQNSVLIEKEKNERLKKENENLSTKIKLLNEGRQLGAVDNDDIYKNYTELQEKFETYKINMENKIKNLNKTIDEMKENQFRESQNNFHKNEIKKNKIQDLQQKINQNSEAFYQESKQYAKKIEENIREIESLKRDIKRYIENEKQLKVRIINLEKELEKEKRETNYYRYGNYTPKTSNSYKSHYSGSSYHNSIHRSTNSKKSSYSNSSANYLKKNLIPSKYKYKVYKPAMSYNYKYSSSKRKTTNSISNKSRKSYGSNSSGKYKNNYVSPYRYNKQASPYRYAVNNKIRSNVNNTKKRNSPFRISNNSKNNYSKNTGSGYHVYNSYKNEVKKNNYVSNNTKSSYKKGNDYEVKKQNINDFKSIGDRLSKIQNLIHQANAK
jgi:hypothetical protein